MSDGTGTEIVGYTLGGVGVGALVMGIVVWLVKALGGRVVQREDDDKKQLQADLKAAAASERSIEKSLFGLERDIRDLRTEVANSAKQSDNRANAQDKEIAELRSEVKEQLVQLEHRLKTDMQRIVSAERPPARRSKPT